MPFGPGWYFSALRGARGRRSMRCLKRRLSWSAALNTAQAINAYTISDRGTWLTAAMASSAIFYMRMRSLRRISRSTSRSGILKDAHSGNFLGNPF